MNVGNAITALRAGWILKNPETWKSRQNAVNALTGLLAAAVAIAKGFGYDIPVTDELLGAAAGGVWAAVSLFNVWGTTATTARIGLPAGGGDGGLDAEPSITGTGSELGQ